MKTTFNVLENINPHFKPVWISNKPYNVLSGGRNSFKSSVTALLAVRLFMSYVAQGERANVVALRKVGDTIRDSIYLNIQWALEKFGILQEFKCTVAPFKIVHKRTGCGFHFYGLNDYQRLKSNNLDDIILVWYEEAAEFKSVEEFDQTNVTFMRQKHPKAPFVYFFWSYNPPRSPYHWINKWKESIKGDKNYLMHESSYLNDELDFVTEQMIEEIERIKQNDPDYYEYLYLGKPLGLGDNVYRMSLFHKIPTIPEGEYLVDLCSSSDTGHQVSATTHGYFGITNTGKVILLDTYYYDPIDSKKTVRGYQQSNGNKKAPSEMSEDFYKFTESVFNCYQVRFDKHTIDSAEGALRNQVYNDYGIKMHPVAKGLKKDMIEYCYDLLARGRMYVLDIPNNQIFLEEHEKYRWKPNKITGVIDPDNPEVIKEDDHTCDMFQYYVKDNLTKLGLKF